MLHKQPEPSWPIITNNIPRDWSLITGRGGGGGGLQNGKIVGPKLFATPPQDRVKLFAPPPSPFKGNLAHKFMIFYFVCLSFHFDISNTLKTKNIENTG